MQVGAFYEVYALLNEDGTYTGSEIANVSRICDLAIANKTGSDINGKPVKMAGFQTYLIDKFSKKLLDAGYTIPVINQDQPAANSTRSLYCILSPGTTFSKIMLFLQTILVAFGLTKFHNLEKNLL